WLDFKTVVLALIFAAIVRWRSGLIMWSSVATMYQEGLSAHAATATFSSKLAARIGPWVAAMRRVSAAGGCWAKCLATVAAGSDANPEASTLRSGSQGGGGKPLVRSLKLPPLSAAAAAT